MKKDNVQERLVELMREVPIARKDYTEYLEALAAHLISKGVTLKSKEVKQNGKKLQH